MLTKLTQGDRVFCAVLKESGFVHSKNDDLVLNVRLDSGQIVSINKRWLRIEESGSLAVPEWTPKRGDEVITSGDNIFVQEVRGKDYGGDYILFCYNPEQDRMYEQIFLESSILIKPGIERDLKLWDMVEVDEVGERQIVKIETYDCNRIVRFSLSRFPFTTFGRSDITFLRPGKEPKQETVKDNIFSFTNEQSIEPLLDKKYETKHFPFVNVEPVKGIRWWWCPCLKYVLNPHQVQGVHCPKCTPIYPPVG